ncbi:MAG: serine/threonine protein kinase, partial [Deltaproteobacteria bacterium]|nr:serine/threonine protein kinase [Deltaproteobacteria bacterium]
VRPGTTLRAGLSLLPRGRTAQPVVAAIELAAGATVGAYRVIERLGEGGMGTVYTVEHKVLGRRHALKVLRPGLVEGERDAADRFLREARAAARIHHANIVDVYDFGHLRDGRPYFVMELLSGESLADRVDRGPLAPSEAIAIIRQLADALAAAHDCGVIHADVTPGNAFLVGDGSVAKLLDFGLAELVGETVRDETNNFVLGTPSYISPEQLLGLAATDRSDQYSLGVVLFELLAGRPPYVNADLRQLCLAHVNAPIPDVMSKFGPLPPKLIDLVTTCLQKSPQARFPGMRAVLAALDEVEQVTDRSGWRRWLSR